jgi:hypothetical protein
VGRHEPLNHSRSNHSTRKRINVWGCVSYHGPIAHRGTSLRRRKTKYASYIEIVRHQLVPYVVENFPLPDFVDPELRVVHENH